MKTLVFGLGNPILSDDGVGIKVVRDLAERIGNDAGISFKEGSVGGLAVLDEIAGFDRLIVVDSIKTVDGRPGQVHKLNPEDFNTPEHLSNFHGVDFFTALKLGKEFGYRMPEDVAIYAVEVQDNVTFCTECTGLVEKSIPRIVKTLESELKETIES
ncbi:hydrogenase maturation protease [candidate division WOR-3 bacterium]|uniref:Hydrogenase maturation protease n=1 Tax=candidate division WOR-3 bacterium TaxID=2052148 RepID=A0A9D5QCT3_UNCW3|nr:hydrogenase maturation protease [candidate division WOR-3 bacterium]MBD3365008.1 hydrogenase maturation protease [candidate division WOR-3 bacterium]